MAVPILLVAGFLGAGKTTLVNHLLAAPDGRRIAAVVNDFGTVNIDAALLGAVADGVVSLTNGCICCTLQGDLLRTLTLLLRREPPPDAIVIETSGVSDPQEILRALLDPVIWRAAALDAVLCLVDAAHLHDNPAIARDALWQSQLRAADFVVLNKADLLEPAALAQAAAALAAFKPAAAIFTARNARVPPELLFSARLHEPVAPRRFRADAATPEFVHLTWTADRPVSLARFQAAIGRLAPDLVRAKGILRFEGQPERPMLFQLAGTRATVAPSPVPPPEGKAAQLVLIGRAGRLDVARAARVLDDDAPLN